MTWPPKDGSLISLWRFKEPGESRRTARDARTTWKLRFVVVVEKTVFLNIPSQRYSSAPLGHSVTMLHLAETGKQSPLPQLNRSGRLSEQSLSVGRGWHAEQGQMSE